MNQLFFIPHLCKRSPVLLLYMASFWLGVEPLDASDWVINPAIEVREVYTDNVLLSPANLAEDDFITVITPAIAISNIRKRTEINLDYSLQNILYLNSGERNTQFHLLHVDGKGEIYEDRLFLDIFLDRSTQNLNNTGNTALDNLSVSSDRGTVLTYGISPYWQQRVGGLMEIDARFKWDEVDSSSFSQSRATDVKISLSSGADFNRLLWDINFKNHKVKNNSARSTLIRNSQFQLKYLLSRKLAIVSEVGYDDNNYENSRGNISGVSWSIGAEWNPSTRTSLKSTYGERFFGDDLELRLTHRSKRTQTQISYEKVPTTTRASLLERQAFNSTDIFGVPIVDPGVQEISDLDLSIVSQSAETIIRSRLTGAFSYNLRKHILSLSAMYEEVDYQFTRQTEFLRRFNLSWNWQIIPKTSSSMSLGWNKNNQRNARDEKYIIAELRLDYKLSTNIEVGVGARFVDRQSNIRQFEYDESRIFADINKRF
ncbi:MAG: TIGR03016 family PEP-CTERM system-associated outer membrane protein [Gammaproteobacteria bacterium]|nr:TIGR03016 family PEP-CTERM system-associated outer membrane protein [Gammaproteobacteria bacterium]